jgi:hypothetical protein
MFNIRTKRVSGALIEVRVNHSMQINIILQAVSICTELKLAVTAADCNATGTVTSIYHQTCVTADVWSSGPVLSPGQSSASSPVVQGI